MILCIHAMLMTNLNNKKYKNDLKDRYVQAL